jgi:hypothetical protein
MLHAGQETGFVQRDATVHRLTTFVDNILSTRPTRNNPELGEQSLSLLPAASIQPNTYSAVDTGEKGEFW